MLFQDCAGHQRHQVQSLRLVAIQLGNNDQQIRPRECRALGDLFMASQNGVFDVDRMVVHAAKADDLIECSNNVDSDVLFSFLSGSSYGTVVQRRRRRDCAADLVDATSSAKRSWGGRDCTSRLRVHLIVIKFTDTACY